MWLQIHTLGRNLMRFDWFSAEGCVTTDFGLLEALSDCTWRRKPVITTTTTGSDNQQSRTTGSEYANFLLKEVSTRKYCSIWCDTIIMMSIFFTFERTDGIDTALRFFYKELSRHSEFPTVVTSVPDLPGRMRDSLMIPPFRAQILLFLLR